MAEGFEDSGAVELPQRGAMRWVTRAAASMGGIKTVAEAHVGRDHPFVREGVLLRSALIEMMAQGAAAGLAMAAAGGGRKITRGVLAAIPELSVYADVPAGGEVHLITMHEKTFGPLSQARLEAHVGGVLVAEARMTFHLTFE